MTAPRRPRVRLVDGPTPLEPAPRLSEALGVELWIKRDDLAGPPLGGNKSRQLEYYLGAAQARDADVILITGAVQSNFVRLAAACAARLGMQTIVQL
ncbi:MAG: pyridoxal-phosphate dependent enzyme, partial [Pseudomonadota bacterium]